MTKLSDIIGSPTREMYPDQAYMSLEDIEGLPITLTDITPFDNHKGPGVAFAFTFTAVGETLDGKCITHAKIVTSTLSDEKVLEHVNGGHPLKTSVKRITSKKSGMRMYVLE